MAEQIIHPLGDPEPKALIPYAEPVRVETFGGRIHVEWDPQASVTALGQLPFFHRIFAHQRIIWRLGVTVSFALD